MTCTQCQGIESLFNQKRAVKELSRYRRKGPRKTTRILIDAVKTEKLNGLAVLDIGGGVGAISNELLDAGASSAIDVDASTAYLDTARDEAKRQGHSDRVTFLHGDFVDVASSIPEVDIVTLDRVICCYPDMAALVRLSSAKAGRIYGVVFPRDTSWVRFVTPIGNLLLGIFGTPFRVYIHKTDSVDTVVRANGFEKLFNRNMPFWQVIVYRRLR